MQTETMTVHKALCEIKILDDRIRKAISNIDQYSNDEWMLI